MSDLIRKLQSLVDSDRFLSSVDLDGVDDMLDARDEEPFEAEWGRLHQLVSKHQLVAAAAVDALRESAFKRAYAITHSPDACGYISDDFGLIADAIRADVSDPWLVALTASYASGHLPHGKLAGDPRSIEEVFA